MLLWVVLGQRCATFPNHAWTCRKVQECACARLCRDVQRCVGCTSIMPKGGEMFFPAYDETRGKQISLQLTLFFIRQESQCQFFSFYMHCMGL